MPFERIAEQRLRQAIEDGLLDDLPNRGERLDLDEYFATPEHVRVAYSILKSANCLPEDVELRNEIAALRQRLANTPVPENRQAIERQIEDRTLRLELLRERDGRMPRR
jgi:Domain of unknown function (DUF1992)